MAMNSGDFISPLLVFVLTWQPGNH